MSTRNPIFSMSLAAGALVAISVLGAWAQVQTSEQQVCINKMNKGASLVAKVQGKENVACVKNAGKGALIITAQACLMLQHASPEASAAFIGSRFDPDWGPVAGISTGTSDPAALLRAAWQ